MSEVICPCCGNRKGCDCYSVQSPQYREIERLNERLTSLSSQLADELVMNERRRKEIAALKDDKVQLVEANEHWHLRVEQLKADVERLTVERDDTRTEAYRECAEAVRSYDQCHTEDAPQT